MLDKIPSGAIKWGHAFSVRAFGDGEHELTFANGSTALSDVLVGADGAHSRVRPPVSLAQPVHHSITGVEISLFPGIAALPEIAETIANVGRGTTYAMENRRILCAQVNCDGHIRTYLWFPGTEDWSHPQTREEWAGPVLMLMERCDGGAMYARTLYARIMSRWALSVVQNSHLPGTEVNRGPPSAHTPGFSALQALRV